MKYEAVIGLELHCELTTETKMFSGAPLGYGKTPNTAINEIDLAYPGTLPQVNQKAIEYGVRLATALNCELDTLLRFDRKNYYYSDLPKGFQITQQDHPIGKKGYVDVLVEEDVERFRIHRMHLEEDTAKQFHEIDKTLIDFNRAGTPLVEIVSEPDLRNGKQAAAFVDTLRLMVIYLGISDGKMEEGSLRCDVNISLRPWGSETYGVKVEIKNLNSIANVQKAIDFECIRQSELLDKKVAIVSETRRFDEKTQKTVSMRTKETMEDYRYFAEPNILPVVLGPDIVRVEPFELPTSRLLRWHRELGLSLYDCKVLIRSKELADYFDAIARQSAEYKIVANWLTQDVLAHWDQKGDRDLAEWINPEHFIEFIDALKKETISSKQAKTVFQKLIEGHSPQQIIAKENLIQVNDEAQISQWITAVLEANPQVIEDYKKGLDKAQKFVVGQVMKLSKGQANPRLTSELAVRILDNH